MATNTVRPVVSGSVAQGSLLQTTNGTWTKDDPTASLVYSYQWRRCDSSGASCVDIAGATSSSYRTQAADVGHDIRARVFASEVPAPPPDPGPGGGGTTYFVSDWESGTKVPPWAGQSSGGDADLVVTTGIDGVTPRSGGKFAKFLARTGVTAFTNQTGRIATMVQTGSINGASAVGNDFFTGFSLYLKSGFQYAPNDYSNNIMEWHCPPGMPQAPIHFFLDGYQGGKYSLDVHIENVGGPYDPKPVWGGLKFGDLLYDQWVDFVFRVKWSTDPAVGIIEGWMNGTKKFSQHLQTWGPATASPYLVAGYYGIDLGHNVTVYLDEIKVGDSYDAVAPA